MGARFNLPRGFSLKWEMAGAHDAPALAALHTAVAVCLTERHGRGPWSFKTTEKGALRAIRNSRVYVARNGDEIAAALRLTTKKPWAIDTSCFTPSERPLYLIAMAVAPPLHRRGIGRWCLEKIAPIAKAWQADVIRLDAYDAPAGAGGFYARCGFTERGRATYRGAPLIYYEMLLR